MAPILNKINGILVEPAVNQNEVEIELNFDVNDPDSKGVVTSNAWEWSRDDSGGAATIINNYVDDGTSGGLGIFEGLPFTSVVQDTTGTVQVYDGYLDLADESTEFACDKVTTTSRLRGGNDWLTDRADNVLFSILECKNEITDADKIQIPYIVSSIPNFREFAIMTLTSFVIVAQVREMGKEIAKVIADVGSITSAIAGIIKVVVLVIHFTLLIIALIKLIKDMKNVLIQPVKYHTGMKLLRQLEAGAQHLGMEFESTIFNDPDIRDAVIIPAKNQTFDNQNGKKGFRFLRGNLKPSVTERAYFDGSYGDLLRLCLDAFNAKLILGDNVIKMERVDKNTSQANFVLPDVEQKTKLTNAFEINSNYIIRFATDSTDTNTTDEYKGTIVQIVTSPKAIKNKDMVLMKGLKRVSIPLALAKRKEELTSIEKVFKTLANAVGPLVNGVITIINGIINLRATIISKIRKFLKRLKTIGIKISFNPRTLSTIPSFDPDKIENRIGMMKLSADFFTRPKILSLDIASTPRQTKIKANNRTIWSGKGLWDNFHFVNSFVPGKGRRNANQWLRFSAVIADFCAAQFLLVKDNNLIFDRDNNIGKIESLLWNLKKSTANISWRVNKLFTSNLQETITEPDGE